jgi:transcriptional repressor NrdR
MICPFCRFEDSRVVDSRPIEDGTQIRRRRECPQCSQRFSTQEVALLNIIKRSGATEPFSREKVLVGVRKACQGRPVNEDDLVLLAQRVEETLRSTGQAEIEAQEVGMAILAPLRELDEVAYLRYASVTVTLPPLKISKARSLYCELCLLAILRRHRKKVIPPLLKKTALHQHHKAIKP